MASGTSVETKHSYRLSYGDPRTFGRDIPGDKKDYHVVIVVDRSGSMRSRGYAAGPIDDAVRAVTQFGLACEALDIDVTVIDFYQDTARLAKPTSIDTEFAKDSLIDTGTGGGTSLADALSLARTTTQTSSRESLIISITDGKPDDVDAVEKQLKASYVPIFSLTIATDRERGNPPRSAERLQDLYEQTTTVYDSNKLTTRLDDFASLLAGY